MSRSKENFENQPHSPIPISSQPDPFTDRKEISKSSTVQNFMFTVPERIPVPNSYTKNLQTFEIKVIGSVAV